MTEPDQSRPRPRWFQFDLRLLFVIIAALGVILALEVARAPRKTQRSLLETLQVGDSIFTDSDANGGVTIHYSRPWQGAPQGTITEIGDDFIAIRRENGNEFFIPLSRLHGVLRSATSPPSPVDAVPQKSWPAVIKTKTL